MLRSFEGIAKTNTTNTYRHKNNHHSQFEGIAKTNTTNTVDSTNPEALSLRVLLKQIQQTQIRVEASDRPV